MTKDFNLIFNDEVEGSDELIYHEEPEPFGSIRYFRGVYREKINGFTNEFLHSNIESIIENNNGDVEQVKTQIGNLVEVYYQARIEFDKHKNKLIF